MKQTSPKPIRKGCVAACLSLLIIALFGGCLLIFSNQILTAIGKGIIYSDPLKKADSIAILSGGGLPRLQEAANIYQEIKGASVILTETGIVTANYGDLSQIEKTQLAEWGVPPKEIQITETHVDTTADEARVILKLLRANGSKSVIVVTDTYHSQRTHLVFQDTFKDSNIEVIIRPVRDDWYKAATWWKSSEGWQVTIEEYSKLFGYYFEQQFLKK